MSQGQGQGNPPQRPPTGDPPVRPTMGTMRRTEAAVRHYERAYRNRPPGGSLGIGVYGTPTAIFRVTTTITARSGATYGTGVGVMQKDTGTALADSTDPSASQPIKNMTNFGMPSGSQHYVLCAFALGKWWAVTPWNCTDLT